MFDGNKWKNKCNIQIYSILVYSDRFYYLINMTRLLERTSRIKKLPVIKKKKKHLISKLRTKIKIIV